MTAREPGVVTLGERRGSVQKRSPSSALDVSSADARRELLRIAAQATRSYGALSLARLVSSAAAHGISSGEDDARLAVAGHAEFLNEDWLFLRNGGANRLTILSRRILSVTSPLDVPIIRAGVCRACARDSDALLPPVGVMADFFRVQPAFGVDTSFRVRPLRELDDRVELGAADRLFVDVLRSSWIGVLEDGSFRNACVSRGMSPRTFASRAPRSAVLDEGPGDIWFLRGTRVSSITAAALRHAREAAARDDGFEFDDAFWE